MLSLSNPIHRAAATPRRARLHVSASAVSTPAPTMYDVLAVPPTAAREEIKAAYRKAALRWHPDACRSPDEKHRHAEHFKEAHAAYEVLSDPGRRCCYDVSVGIGGGFEGRERREGFRVWESQLEGLGRRVSPEDTWAARVRRANARDQYRPSD